MLDATPQGDGAPILVMLCGLPAAGKTTVRERILAAHPDIAVISSDDRIEAIASERGETYAEIYPRHAKRVAERIRRDAENLFAEGRSLIWDQTNLTEEARAGILAMAPEGYVKLALSVEAPMGVLNRRLRARKESGKVIPCSVVKAMRSTWRRPRLEEGFDTVQVARSA